MVGLTKRALSCKARFVGAQAVQGLRAPPTQSCGSSGPCRLQPLGAVLGGPLRDPAASTVLHATDQLAFALVRYGAEHDFPRH